jgi:hypothetical protein
MVYMTKECLPCLLVAHKEREKQVAKKGTNMAQQNPITGREFSQTLLNLCDPGPVPLTVFDSHRLPEMSLDGYVERLIRYLCRGEESFILALVYVDRLLIKWPRWRLTSFNIHRVVLACLLLAVKINEDEVRSNHYYARVGGVTLAELNRLEAVLCAALEWRLYVSMEVYAQYRQRVRERCPLHRTASSTRTCTLRA